MTSNALAVQEQREQHPLVLGIQQRMASPGFAVMLPPGMDVDRFAAVTIQAIVKNPDLLSCTPESVIAAVIEAAQDGLEPTGARGGAHLVKFGPEAVLIRDYRGIIRIVIESGAASRVDAREVHRGDEFALDYASPDPVTHRPQIPPSGDVIGYYSLFWLPDGTKQAEFMTVDEVEHVRAQSRGKDSLGWTKFFGQMARKTVIKRGANYLNLRPDIRERLMREDSAEFEGQIISVQRDERLGAARSRIHDRAARLTGGATEQPGQDAGVPVDRPAPAPRYDDSPPCRHLPAHHQTTDVAVVCGDCGQVLAEREQPVPVAGGGAVDTAARGPEPEQPPAAGPTSTLSAATMRVGTLALSHHLVSKLDSDADWQAFDDVLRMLGVEPLALDESPETVAAWNALGDRIELGEFASAIADPAGRCGAHDAPWKWVAPGTNKTTGKAFNGFFACSGDRDCKARPTDAWRKAHKPAPVVTA